MKTSKRTNQMSEPALLKYYPLVEEAQKDGKKVYFLNIGQPDIKTPTCFLKAVGGFKEKVIAYQAPEGLLALREASADYYQRIGLDFSKDDVYITNGGSEALLFTFISICDAGDEIITAEPLYSIYKEIAAACNVKLVGIKTEVEDGFLLPAKDQIEALITDRTRCLLMTNPGNPTGKVYGKEEIDMLESLALKHDLFIVTDEVYREFLYDDCSYLSPAQNKDLTDHVILVDSISKRYSACGARIGFIVSKNKAFKESVKKLCQMRLSVSIIDQVGAAELMTLDHEFFKEILDEYTHRRKIVYQGLQAIPGVICKLPRGAFYFMVRLPIKKAADFIEWLVRDFSYENETVLLSPANDFYLNPLDGEDQVRLAYVLNAKDMKRAMLLLEKGLEAYHQKYPERFKEK